MNTEKTENTTNFDHSKNDIYEALGIDKQQFAEKNSQIASDYVAKANKGETISVSKIAEEVARTFSYNELVLGAVRHNMDVAAQAVKLKNNTEAIFKKMLKKIKKSK